MKEISFKELHDLVANIDPALDSIGSTTFPIFFSVVNGKEKKYFSAGVTTFEREDFPDYPDFHDTEFYKDDYATTEEEYNAYRDYDRKYPMSILENEELQTLVSYDDYYWGGRKVLDTQKEGGMNYEQIGKMLKEKCNINETSKIMFYEHRSFNGRLHNIDPEEALDTYHPKFWL